MWAASLIIKKVPKIANTQQAKIRSMVTLQLTFKTAQI
jgi:hypothetical protein